VPAHKIILSANSPYFAAMFNSQLKESNAKDVLIQDIDGETLELLVNYCYTGAIPINEENVEKILSTACIFQMPHVKLACSAFLGRQLHITNAIGFTLFAEQQNCEDLYNLSLSFTAKNFMEIYQNSDEFLRMNVNQLSALLKNNDLNVQSEEDVFKALIKWLSHSEDRQDHLKELLPLVKLSQLSPVFISDHVEAYCNTIETQKILLDAFKWQLIPERRNLSSDYSVPRKSTIGKILTIGGMDQHKGSISIEAYDPRENTWDVLKNMPTRRLQFGCALYMDKLLIVGGRDGLKTLNNVDSIDLQTMHWTSLSCPLTTARHGLGLALLKGALYAVGGHDGWSYLNSVERLDLTTKTWSYVQPMSTMRSTAGVAILDDRLYVVGGRESSICHRTVEVYCPHTNRWTMKAPMNKRRGSVSIVAYNKALYVFGGHDLPVSSKLLC
jgi:kelch-like protein 1/4/5